MKALVLVVIFVPSVALSQDDLMAKYRNGIESCWQAAAGAPEAAKACDGMLAEACMNAEPGGMSNLGMSQCLYAEAGFWDEVLNAEWRKAIALVQQADTDSLDYEPDFAMREEKLRAAQRAWIGFRDAQCAFDTSIHGSGSLRQLYAPSCLSEMTFQRVMDLVGIRAEFGG